MSDHPAATVRYELNTGVTCICRLWSHDHMRDIDLLIITIFIFLPKVLYFQGFRN